MGATGNMNPKEFLGLTMILAVLAMIPTAYFQAQDYGWALLGYAAGVASSLTVIRIEEDSSSKLGSEEVRE